MYFFHKKKSAEAVHIILRILLPDLENLGKIEQQGIGQCR
jgi:hypothetical protein